MASLEHPPAGAAASVAFAYLPRSHQRTLDRHLPRVVCEDAPLRHRQISGLEGLTWTKQFSIYDEADAQSLVKEIVTQELQLDPKRFDPKKTRWAISNAKNQGWLPDQLEANAEGQRGSSPPMFTGVTAKHWRPIMPSTLTICCSSPCSCCSKTTRCAATGTVASVMFWWMSIRTPIAPSTT